MLQQNNSIGNILKIWWALGSFLSACHATCPVFFSAITILNTRNTCYAMCKIKERKMIGSNLLMIDSSKFKNNVFALFKGVFKVNFLPLIIFVSI